MRLMRYCTNPCANGLRKTTKLYKIVLPKDQRHPGEVHVNLTCVRQAYGTHSGATREIKGIFESSRSHYTWFVLHVVAYGWFIFLNIC